MEINYRSLDGLWVPIAGGSGPVQVGYPAEILLDSPIGLWMMDETLATAAIDLSGTFAPLPYTSDFYPESDGFFPLAAGPGSDASGARPSVAFWGKQAPADDTPSLAVVKGYTLPEIVEDTDALTIGFWARYDPGLPSVVSFSLGWVFAGITETPSNSVDFFLEWWEGAVTIYTSVSGYESAGPADYWANYWVSDGLDDATADNAFHFYSLVLKRNEAPDLRIDNVPVSMVTDGGSGTPPGSGNWQPIGTGLEFYVYSYDDDLEYGYSTNAMGLYICPGDIGNSQRTAHYAAIDPGV